MFVVEWLPLLLVLFRSQDIIHNRLPTRGSSGGSPAGMPAVVDAGSRVHTGGVSVDYGVARADYGAAACVPRYLRHRETPQGGGSLATRRRWLVSRSRGAWGRMRRCVAMVSRHCLPTQSQHAAPLGWLSLSLAFLRLSLARHVGETCRWVAAR